MQLRGLVAALALTGCGGGGAAVAADEPAAAVAAAVAAEEEATVPTVAPAPNRQCVESCVMTHEPGAHYDDDGEYVRDEDTRDDAQKQRDREACEESCAGVPVLDDDELSACVDACTADGRDEGVCKSECDPDPYDLCRYTPCD